MGKRGPKAKGNLFEETVGTDTIPRCPAFLGKIGRRKWAEVTGELSRLGLLSSLDAAVISIYCQQWELWSQAMASMKGKYLEKDGQPKGQLLVARGALINLRELSKQLLLTPASRMQVRGFKPKRKKDAIARALEKSGRTVQ